MALADEISLQLANESGRSPDFRPADMVSSSLRGAGQIMQLGRVQADEAAAEQFQQVLNQGFTAMQQAHKSLPPELQMRVGDPTFYQKDEDSMAAWWANLSKVQEAETKKAATAKSLEQAAGGDAKGAIQSLGSAGAIPPDAAVTGMAAADKQARYDERGKKIAGLLGEVQKETSVDGKVDLNSQLGRQFKITSKRLESIMPIIDKAAADSGVPANLIKAIISQESTGKNGLTSSAGAKGYMQLMPATAKELGVTNVNDPQQNIEGGTKYIGQLLQKYGGDHEKAIAAYNAGPGTVDRAIKKYGDEWKDNLPDETKDYLEKVPSYLKAYGGATFSSSEDGTNPSLVGIAKKAADADPDLLVDERYKAIQDAVDKDADNRRLVRTDLQRERLENQKHREMQRRIDNIYERAKGKYDIARVYKELDDALPGGINGTQSITGVGVGENKFKDWFIGTTKDSHVGKVRSAIAKLVNVTLKNQSGLTITESEAKNVMRELGLQATSTEADFRHAIKTRMAQDEQDYAEALSVDPEARDEMMQRDPGKTNPFKLKQRAGGSPGGSITTKSGKTIKVSFKKTE